MTTGEKLTHPAAISKRREKPAAPCAPTAVLSAASNKRRFARSPLRLHQSTRTNSNLRSEPESTSERSTARNSSYGWRLKGRSDRPHRLHVCIEHRV